MSRLRASSFTSALFAPALLLAAALGCTRIQPPLTPPENGGAEWREMVSKHVILRTDRGEDDAREALVDLEQTFTALHEIAFPQVKVDGSRILVVHFARQRDFDAFSPSNLAGYFRAKLPNDLEPEPAMVVWGKLDAAARTTLQHELTHMFVHATAGGLPPWMNEGLAKYYETLVVEDGFAFVGRPLSTARAWPKTEWGTERVGAYMMADVPVGSVPSVKDLVAMDGRAFQVWTDKGRQPTLDEVRALTTHYLGGWGLVHMLLHDPAYQPRYDAMMDLVSKGVQVRDAWDQSFEGVDAGKMETDYRRHMLNRYETMVLKTPYKHPEVTAEPSRPMEAPEVHLLWARLRPWRGADLPAAKADVETAKMLAPSSPEVGFWSGVFHLRVEDDPASAEADIEKALTAKPAEPRYLLAYAIARRKQADKAPSDAEAAKREDEAFGRLSKVAATGAELNAVADFHERRGRWDDALVFAERAVMADPTCAGCFESLGEVLFVKKRFTDAVQAQQISLSLLPDGATAPAAEEKLEKYLKAAWHASQKSAPPPAPEGDKPLPKP